MSEPVDHPEEERVPVEQVLGGLKIHPLDDGARPTSAFDLIKTVDADGDSRWAYRTTEQPNLEELLGALVVQADLIRRELTKAWE